MMKTLMIVAAGLLIGSGLKAQTIQEGVNHLYADRFKSATGVFEKLLAANPNNIEATYWLGQTYLDEDQNEKARQLYDKALTTSANAPLLLVGRGHVDLLDKKTAEGKQKFETAITMTRGRKGDDPVILNAIGRANVDAKDGDLPYAIEKLKTAAERDDKNADIFLNLGNAYRKAKPGEGGGDAYQNYKRALEINPNFVVAYIRLAKLFEAQKNWDLVLQNLNDAVAKDPKFTLGYYELFYYYFFRQKFDDAEGFLKKYIDSKLPEKDPQDEFLYAQLCWARKDFTCAISKGEGVVAVTGAQTKPKVLKLLADAYMQKGDSTSAKKYIDQYFSREKQEDLIGFDYVLKAKIYSKFPGNEDVVFTSFEQAVKIDTVIDSKVDILKEAAEFFRKSGQRVKEGDMMVKLLEIKPKPTINDMFDAGRAYYFGKEYGKSRAIFQEFIKKYPAEIYGFEWSFNNARVIDTVKKDSIAVPDALALLDFAQKDTAKFGKQVSSSSYFLALYHAGKNEREKAVEYLTIMKSVERDPAKQESIQNNIETLSKPAPKSPTQRTGTTGGSPAKTGGSKPVPAAKPKTTVAGSTGAVKK